MSKWRPTPTGCMYVIPDIHGNHDELKLILKRILPLRNNADARDILIFLGDYIDRGPDSPGVLDTIIDVKKKYSDQVVCLMGNHEQLMMMSLGILPSWTDPTRPSPFAVWFRNGGSKTVSQYAARAGVDIEIDGLVIGDQDRLCSFVESKHLDFLRKNAVTHFETDDYIFVHAGCDPTVPIKDQDEEVLLWDRSLFDFCRKMISTNNILPWDKTVVTGHCFAGPYVTSKFMMLDSLIGKKLIVVELNSMESFAAVIGNKRLVRQKLNDAEQKVKSPIFRRAFA